VAGGSFAVSQFVFATIHVHVPAIVVFPMTDVGAGILSLVVTAAFLRFWKPKKEWHFPPPAALKREASSGPAPDPGDPRTAEAKAMLEGVAPQPGKETPLNFKNIALAWAPFVIMSGTLLLSGLVRERESARARRGESPLMFGPIQTSYSFPLPWLDRNVDRDPELFPVKMEQAAVLACMNGGDPLAAVVDTRLAVQVAPKPEVAEFNFNWATTPGSPVFLAALLSMALLRMKSGAVFEVFARTCKQMKVPIPTIAFMLGLSSITRFAGMDATLGVAFALTGAAYPFFAAILGWLGVFLTGTDAGSNAQNG
jgi:lactate permease